MDSILIKNLRVHTRIGVPEEERRSPQELLVTIELLHPTHEVARSDDAEKGIDYDRVVGEILKIAKIERKTVERFAEDVASMIVQTFKPHGGARVTVEKKPSLPVDSVRIIIERP